MPKISGDVATLLGSDHNVGDPVALWVEPSQPITMSGSTGLVGGKVRIDVADDGTFTTPTLPATSGVPLYRLVIDSRSLRRAGNPRGMTTKWFPLEVDRDLTWIVANYVDITAISTETEANIAAAAALGATNDTATASFVNNGASATRAALDGRFETLTGAAGKYAPIPKSGQNGRNPLTNAYHVESFGAKGDWNGTTGTDNLAPLNAIVAAILATPNKTGRIVFGPGKFWLSNDWMIDGEDVEVICHQETEIFTTSTTTRGAAVHFIGGGVQSPNNFVLTPQRRRFVWRGGRISATGSGTLDNALGVVRVASCHVSDVRLDADRKAITPQINVDNITIERVVVERGDYDAVCIETGCMNVTVRDVDVIATLGTGVRIFSDSATDPDRKVRNVLLERVTVRSAGAFAVSMSDTEKVTLSQVSGSILQLNGRIADLQINADCSFDTINFPSDMTTLPVTTAKPLATPVTFANSWVAYGNPFPTPNVRKGADGFTNVEIAIKSGTMTAGTQLGTIPRGYRPANRVILTALANGTPAYVYAENTGSIILASTLSTNALLTITGRFPAV